MPKIDQAETFGGNWTRRKYWLSRRYSMNIGVDMLRAMALTTDNQIQAQAGRAYWRQVMIWRQNHLFR
jgi:hypothetical protein